MRIYFSLNLKLAPIDVLNALKNKFEVELLYDGKEHAIAIRGINENSTNNRKPSESD